MVEWCNVLLIPLSCTDRDGTREVSAPAEPPAPGDGRGDLAPHHGGEPGLVLGERGLARGGEGVAINALARLATRGRVITRVEHSIFH